MKSANPSNRIKRALGEFSVILTLGDQRRHYGAAEARIKIVATFARSSIITAFTLQCSLLTCSMAQIPFSALIMSWFLTNFIAAFLLPPLNLLLLSLSGLLIWHKNPRVARILLSLAFILLWLLSTPFVAEFLLQSLENHSAVAINKQSSADAIVVLSGGTYFHAPEYAGDTVSPTSLQRLRYAATLYRNFKKPILLTGGAPRGSDVSEAKQMKQVLEQEFNIPVQWIDEKSDNTLESARNSYQLLYSAGIKRIYLVTHAWHMQRSAKAFQSAGFEVIPAPTAYTTRFQINAITFMPSADALQQSRIFLHETIGILWYRLKS